MGEKLKFSFSKSSLLDKAIRDLRRYNQDFRTLLSQSAEEATINPEKPSRLKTRSSKEVEKHRDVGKAAQLVYDALRKACTKHTDHLAHFCVQVEDVTFDYGCLAKIKFSISFTHMMSSGSVYQEDPVWFVVDSTLDRPTAMPDEHTSHKFEDFKQTLKRQVNSIPERTAKKPKTSVSFQSSLLHSSCGVTSSTLASMLSTEIVPGEKFCDFLRQSFARPITFCNVPLPALENSTFCRQLIYPLPAKNTQLDQPISLSQLVSPQNGRRRMEDFSPYERVRLAKTLAIAVLQYHATPWLRETWRSEDVYFFGLDDKTKDVPVLTPPYVNANVSNRNGHVSQTLPLVTREMARNSLLFSLGVFLIEIALQISLISLQRPIDLEDARTDRNTEFFVARRISKAKCTGMGPRYDAVIRRLVECDFGCGDNLNTQELQDAFHDTVISPLDTLEQELRKIHLDDS